MEIYNPDNFKRKAEKNPSEILLVDCDLSVRAYNCLNVLGFNNLEELSVLTE